MTFYEAIFFGFAEFLSGMSDSECPAGNEDLGSKPGKHRLREIGRKSPSPAGHCEWHCIS